MSTLSDGWIKARLDRGDLTLFPVDERCIKSNSYDIHLGGSEVQVQRAPINMAITPPFAGNYTEYVIDPMHPDPELWTAAPLPYLLRSQRSCLAVTLEHIEIPSDIEVELYGRSTIGRSGLNITNAGVLDAGWRGYTTLELFNTTEHPIRLTPGMDIGQYVFRLLTAPAERPYGSDGLSRYQDQGPIPQIPRPKPAPIQPSQQRVIDELAKVEWPSR